MSIFTIDTQLQLLNNYILLSFDLEYPNNRTPITAIQTPSMLKGLSDKWKYNVVNKIIKTRRKAFSTECVTKSVLRSTKYDTKLYNANINPFSTNKPPNPM